MNHITINFENSEKTISKYIYGHFAEHLGKCIYGGFYVGKDSDSPNKNGIRTDIITALNHIKVPVLRWPGGCFADEYHWMDGVGKRQNRQKSINTHWGMVTESHEFGTHEFFELCEMLNCDAYVAGNLASGTVKEMQDWVDYISCEKGSSMSSLRIENGKAKPWKLPFFGIGNESWGCGGWMTPDYYSDLYRQYQTYVRSYPGNTIKKIACGPNEDDYIWTDTVMKKAGKFMWGLSLHYYTRTYNTFSKMGKATDFDLQAWNNIIKYSYLMDKYLTKHSAIMDKYDHEKKVAIVVDEWGTWYQTKLGTNKRFLYQQNTIRDAISASIHFNIFHKHCERVKMANLAQTINVLQAVLLTDGNVLIKTPTYHVFDLYKCHQDNQLLAINEIVNQNNGINVLSSTASYNEKEKTIYFSICNSNALNEESCTLSLKNIEHINAISGRIVAGEKIDSHNTAENLNSVSVKEYSSFSHNKKEVQLMLPPRCIITLSISI